MMRIPPPLAADVWWPPGSAGCWLCHSATRNDRSRETERRKGGVRTNSAARHHRRSIIMTFSLTIVGVSGCSGAASAGLTRGTSSRQHVPTTNKVSAATKQPAARRSTNAPPGRNVKKQPPPPASAPAGAEQQRRWSGGRKDVQQQEQEPAAAAHHHHLWASAAAAAAAAAVLLAAANGAAAAEDDPPLPGPEAFGRDFKVRPPRHGEKTSSTRRLLAAAHHPKLLPAPCRLIRLMLMVGSFAFLVPT